MPLKVINNTMIKYKRYENGIIQKKMYVLYGKN